MNSRASGGGGGLYGRTNSVVNAENCVFENNYALYGGAILFEDYSTLSLKNIVCSSNLVDVDGGCLKLSNQVSGSVNDSTFFNNTAKTEGGGIQIGQNSQVTFRNILVRGNFAEGLAGGALHTGSSIVNYIDSVFESNTCNSNGGGMGIKTQAHVVVQNTIFQKNHARGGGAIYTDSKGGLSALNNCSFLNNTASFGGAAFFDLGTQKNIISDAIMMGNQADAGGTFFYNVWQRLLEFNNITFVENKAIYGDIEATKPWKMIPLPLATTEFSPKDTFSVTLKLIDFFNNTAVSTVNQIIVNMRGSEGMTVQSIFYLQPFINGFVTFSNVAVAGRLQESYSLSFSSTELPNVIIPVTIVSCGPGYAKTSVDGDVYTCARCPSGQYSLVVDGACRICPPGGDCSNGGANLTTLEGWWMDPASLVSNDPKLYNCEAGTCLGQSKCAANREGRICSKCVDGFRFDCYFNFLDYIFQKGV
ncbi:hypothetical protein HMI55_004370 [Coelomomyces lativittatus]|nr:hypothetical protein HMI55_004370 [Coelomomyces lativittatus]